jgi:hypothetical protein
VTERTVCCRQVVGILSLFVWPAPMTVKQMYLTCTGVIVAYAFTWVPEWTTWTLLLAMAIYDLFAVLLPGGPLKVRALAPPHFAPVATVTPALVIGVAVCAAV